MIKKIKQTKEKPEVILCKNEQIAHANFTLMLKSNINCLYAFSYLPPQIEADHQFILLQTAGKKEPVFQIFQSYVERYSLQDYLDRGGHRLLNKDQALEFMHNFHLLQMAEKVSEKSMLNFLTKNISGFSLLKQWNEETMNIYQKLFHVDTSHLKEKRFLASTIQCTFMDLDQ